MIDSTYLVAVGFPAGTTLPVRVLHAGRPLFEFTVSPPGADHSVTLTETKNVVLTDNRCRVTLQ